jgi:hypothetical protein
MPWPTAPGDDRPPGHANGGKVKWLLIGLMLVVAVSSQNILPIHIAFIPLLVPPLLYVLTRLRIDRRLIACVITFGLITPYMFLPVGFGNIFLNEILLANVARAGVDVSGSMSPTPWPSRRWACSSACCWRCSSAIARSATTTWRDRAGRAGQRAVQPADLVVAGWRLPRRSLSSCGWTR